MKRISPIILVAAVLLVTIEAAADAVFTETINMNNNTISNLPQPPTASSAATKAYVDALELRVQQQAEQLDRLTSMVLIPAGYFQMGTNNLPNEAEMTDAGPNHQVFVSSFYMDKYEVTLTLWTNVYQWATSHGYSFVTGWGGNGGAYPINYVTWYNVVKWCNARSEMLGLTPCYYTNDAQTLVYRGGLVGISNEWVKWTANGFRLPTEAEWEKAARGGAVGMRFSWSQTNFIGHDLANFRNIGGESYQYGTTGYHPSFPFWPNSSPVGYFAPNGYGLYDMTGNVWEWCWDWYSNTYYAVSASSDPRGPASGTQRVLRGGSWYNVAAEARCANRDHPAPSYEYDHIGFRCVRGL